MPRYIIEYEVSRNENGCLTTFAAEIADCVDDAAQQFAEKHPGAIIHSFKLVTDEHEAFDNYGLGSWTDDEQAEHRDRMKERLASLNAEHKEARRNAEGYSLEEFAAEQEYQSRRDAETTSNLDGVHVGDIFCSCWGYDQTNYDFYQVVEVKGKHTVIVQENACNGELCGDWSGYKRPIRDQFVNDRRYTLRTSINDYTKKPWMRNPELEGRHMMEPVTFGMLYQYSTGA